MIVALCFLAIGNGIANMIAMCMGNDNIVGFDLIGFTGDVGLPLRKGSITITFPSDSIFHAAWLK